MPQKHQAEKKVLELLDSHHRTFSELVPLARQTGHPVPVDTRGWSQILVSVLTGIRGLERRKGADLNDGSDVKGACTWEAIDTPRFNGVIKAGTKAEASGSLTSLDAMPFLFFVLWDHATRREGQVPRFRIWCVRTQVDPLFRDVCSRWYEAVETGKIRSSNFQLHPPRGLDSDEIRNSFGSLNYPLLFCAERTDGRSFSSVTHDEAVLTRGECRWA